jgi:hypothetical protein
MSELSRSVRLPERLARRRAAVALALFESPFYLLYPWGGAFLTPIGFGTVGRPDVGPRASHCSHSRLTTRTTLGKSFGLPAGAPGPSGGPWRPAANPKKAPGGHGGQRLAAFSLGPVKDRVASSELISRRLRELESESMQLESAFRVKTRAPERPALEAKRPGGSWPKAEWPLSSCRSGIADDGPGLPSSLRVGDLARRGRPARSSPGGHR